MPDAVATPPWRRAPLLLLRRPVVWAAASVAVAVLGLAAASGVLFVSTPATAGLRAHTAADCPESAMPQPQVDAPSARLADANATTVATLRPVTTPAAPFAVDVTQLSITWIMGYLRALAILAGAVAVAGLVFGLGARTRQRTSRT